MTLGSFSLFRGIAEGITQGAENYSRLSRRASCVWARAISAAWCRCSFRSCWSAIAGYWVLLHRSADRAHALRGRLQSAAARATRASRCSGAWRCVYFLSGVVSSLAAIIYVAHLGQAKSDAGTGYELAAITAVVLGGTSVFGGRGTVWGTVLGLFAISVLQNGLRLAALPSEMTGVLTGVVLVLTIGLGRLRGRRTESEPDN